MHLGLELGVWVGGECKRLKTKTSLAQKEALSMHILVCNSYIFLKYQKFVAMETALLELREQISVCHL